MRPGIRELTAIGDFLFPAKLVFNWIADKRYDDGSFWMGATFPDGVIWPAEKTGWMAAATACGIWVQ
ncbi:MAG: hypothetical protein AB2L12_14340 [Smithellaceae bacterium]